MQLEHGNVHVYKETCGYSGQVYILNNGDNFLVNIKCIPHLLLLYMNKKAVLVVVVVVVVLVTNNVQ